MDITDLLKSQKGAADELARYLHCSHCGAQPYALCRTGTGNYAPYHMARVHVIYQAWAYGWSMGAYEHTWAGKTD